MTREIIKINDNIVCVNDITLNPLTNQNITTSKFYNKVELINRKANLLKNIEDIDTMINILN